MNEEVGGGSEIIVLLDGKGNRSDVEKFWRELGGKGVVQPPDQSDSNAAENMAMGTKLFKFSEDETGRIDVSHMSLFHFFSLTCIDILYFWGNALQIHAG